MHKFFCRYIFKRGFRAVDEDLSVMDFHCFTGKSDDAFNKKLLFVIRVSEDNDIEPFRFAEYISKPVSENTVSGQLIRDQMAAIIQRILSLTIKQEITEQKMTMKKRRRGHPAPEKCL